MSAGTTETLLAQAGGLLRAADRHRWLAFGVAAFAFVAWSVAIGFVPERYEASARVYVDTQTVLKPLMAGLTFQPDIDQQVKMLGRTLVSRENIEHLIANPELGLKARNPAQHEALVARLMDHVTVTPTSAGNLFDISYRGESAEGARRLVDAMVDLFVKSGANNRQHDAQGAERFIDEQIKSYEAMLTDSENRLRDFKSRNFGVSGVPSQDYFSRVSSLRDDADKLRSALSAAERSRDALRRELDGETLPTVAADGPGSAGDLAQRLEQQRRALDDLQRRFTEAHPEVIATRHSVAELEAALAARIDAERRTGAQPGSGRVALGSPVFQRLRISLAEAESQVAGLRSQLASELGRLAQVQAMAGRQPQVEAELVQLNRDYDIIRKNYEAMVIRRESALLGARLDSSAPLADFRVIDPARGAPSPVFPGRLHLAAIGALASLAAGLAAALGAEKLRPTVDDTSTLRALTGRPVLGSIPMTITPPLRARMHRARLRFIAAGTCLVAGQAAWIAWLAVRPVLG